MMKINFGSRCNNLIAVFFVAAILFISCKNNQGPPAEHVSNMDIELADFYEFYGRFHQDTAFQLAHITFPLEGKHPNQELSTDNAPFYWQKADWVYHKPFDFEMSPYERKISPLGDDLVVEYIVHKKLGFGMMRRFAKFGNDWFLIYYAGMNTFGNE